MAFDTGGLNCVVCGIRRDEYQKLKEEGWEPPCIMGTAPYHHAFLKNDKAWLLVASENLPRSDAPELKLSDEAKKRLILKHIPTPSGFSAPPKPVVISGGGPHEV